MEADRSDASAAPANGCNGWSGYFHGPRVCSLAVVYANDRCQLQLEQRPALHAWMGRRQISVRLEQPSSEGAAVLQVMFTPAVGSPLCSNHSGSSYQGSISLFESLSDEWTSQVLAGSQQVIVAVLARCLLGDQYTAPCRGRPRCHLTTCKYQEPLSLHFMLLQLCQLQYQMCITRFLMHGTADPSWADDACRLCQWVGFVPREPEGGAQRYEACMSWPSKKKCVWCSTLLQVCRKACPGHQFLAWKFKEGVANKQGASNVHRVMTRTVGSLGTLHQHIWPLTRRSMSFHLPTQFSSNRPWSKASQPCCASVDLNPCWSPSSAWAQPLAEAIGDVLCPAWLCNLCGTLYIIAITITPSHRIIWKQCSSCNPCAHLEHLPACWPLEHAKPMLVGTSGTNCYGTAHIEFVVAMGSWCKHLSLQSCGSRCRLALHSFSVQQGPVRRRVQCGADVHCHGRAFAWHITATSWTPHFAIRNVRDKAWTILGWLDPSAVSKPERKLIRYCVLS